MSIRAGSLDRRITVQQATTTLDSFGEPIKAWADLCTVWAQVKPVGGNERFQGQQVNPEVDTRFIIRYRTDVRVAQRVVYDGEQYDVLGILEIGRHAGQELLAKLEKP